MKISLLAPFVRRPLLMSGLTICCFATAHANGEWFVSSSGGISSGWNADQQFFPPNAPSLPLPPGTGGGAVVRPVTHRFAASSQPVASLSGGYDKNLDSGLSFQAELEAILLPQKYTVYSRDMGSTGTIGGGLPTPMAETLLHTWRVQDYAFVGNVGIAAANVPLQPYVMAGYGRISSSDAKSANVWQMKSGIRWKINGSWRVGLEAKYLEVNNYTLSPDVYGTNGLGIYSFGRVRTVAGVARVSLGF